MKNLSLKKLAISLAAVSAIAVTAPTFAEGFYIGAGVSQSFVDENGLDDDATGGKVFGGYKFNDYFAIEGAYYDFGDLGDSAGDLEIDGVSLAAVGSIPVSSNLSLFGKVGGHDWDADSTGIAGSQLTSDSDSDLFYGVGVEYNLTGNISLRGEVERYEVEEIDVDVATFGVSFRF